MRKAVTYRALLLRVNRQLEAEGSILKRCRESASDYGALGPYYLVLRWADRGSKTRSGSLRAKNWGAESV